jgi:hypothetical protein
VSTTGESLEKRRKWSDVGLGDLLLFVAGCVIGHLKVLADDGHWVQGSGSSEGNQTQKDELK